MFGANAGYQQFDLEYGNPTHPFFDPRAAEPANFWERFKFAFDQQVDGVFADQLHPLGLLGWTLKHADASPEQFLEHGTHTAHRAFAASVQYSLREAAVSLPIMSWLESRQELLGEFLSDSVNAVEEEAVSPLDSSYRPAERTWWNAVSAKSLMRYGIRPFSTAPYAFLSFGVREGDRALLLGHVRYYYRNLADHRFELALSLPLAGGFAIDFGTSYQFGVHDTEKKLVLKLFKQLKHGGIVHAGMEAQRNPVLFAGISIPW